jgi:hypothetical protein
MGNIDQDMRGLVRTYGFLAVIRSLRAVVFEILRGAETDVGSQGKVKSPSQESMDVIGIRCVSEVLEHMGDAVSAAHAATINDAWPMLKLREGERLLFDTAPA